MVGSTDSLSNGMTTGPPPKMMVPIAPLALKSEVIDAVVHVPARYMLANKLKPLWSIVPTPRRAMMMMKLMKKPTITMAPNFQEKTRISRLAGTTLSSSFTTWAVLLLGDIRSECVAVCPCLRNRASEDRSIDSTGSGWLSKSPSTGLLRRFKLLASL